MMPSADRTYEAFWRQAARWLASEAPEPRERHRPGRTPRSATAAPIDVSVRNASFEPVPDAQVHVSVRDPGGATRDVPSSAAGRDDRPACRRVRAGGARACTAYRWKRSGGDVVLGSIEQSVLAGGTDPEFVDPRLNETVLRQLAEASGGRYLRAARRRARGRRAARTARACAPGRGQGPVAQRMVVSADRRPPHRRVGASPAMGAPLTRVLPSSSSVVAACWAASGACAAAQNRSAVIVFGAPGGDTYADDVRASGKTRSCRACAIGLGFPPDRITVLSGRATDPSRRSTEANVRRVFAGLRVRRSGRCRARGADRPRHPRRRRARSSTWWVRISTRRSGRRLVDGLPGPARVRQCDRRELSVPRAGLRAATAS